jgi:hypothetical protein
MPDRGRYAARCRVSYVEDLALGCCIRSATARSKSACPPREETAGIMGVRRKRFGFERIFEKRG